MQPIRSVRGMNDFKPDETPSWLYVEEICRHLCQSYGYHEIRFPIVEQTDLFRRTVGEVTDIVEKEMYTFSDRNGDQLSLRPEGTAGCVRAGVEQGLLYNQIQRLWYMGPMFRHERPQKGRYRQFHQLGVEAFGIKGPELDVELILICARLWRELGIANQLVLQINSLGTTEVRASYREKLVAYFKQHHHLLDADSVKRLASNPLRILDSKNPAMADMLAGAPALLDELDEPARAHFDTVCRLLKEAGVEFQINPRLVRGLDYYNQTVFEWVTDALGAQGTVAAGGRYDGLVEQLGGKATPAAGFAIGLERLIGLVSHQQEMNYFPHVYMVLGGDFAYHHGLVLAESLRDQVPGLRVEVDLSGASTKAQFKRADKSGAAYAVVLGDAEAGKEEVTLKALQKNQAPQYFSELALASFLYEKIILEA